MQSALGWKEECTDVNDYRSFHSSIYKGRESFLCLWSRSYKHCPVSGTSSSLCPWGIRGSRSTISHARLTRLLQLICEASIFFGFLELPLFSFRTIVRFIFTYPTGMSVRPIHFCRCSSLENSESNDAQEEDYQVAPSQFLIQNARSSRCESGSISRNHDDRDTREEFLDADAGLCAGHPCDCSTGSATGI